MNKKKHYYTEGQRVCSKIGGGFANVNYNVFEEVQYVRMDYNEQRANQEKGVREAFENCIREEVITYNAQDKIFDAMQNEITRDTAEPAFYFLSDHLGSSSYITNNSGQVTQTMSYTPFGEWQVDYVNSTNNPLSFSTPYKFNGKEKDRESGFSYFGARYYWDYLSVWLSVDPKSHLYPNLSPMAYCANNPVKYIDPNGKEIWINGSEGKAAYNQLEKGAKRYGIKTSMNSEGKVSATYIGKGEISAEGQQILDAANRTDITINLNTTDGYRTTDGESNFVGGAFMGNKLKMTQSKIGKDDFLGMKITGVDAYQDINPNVLSKLDNYYGRTGQTMVHELLEAYTGAVMALEKGVASSRAGLPGSFYPEVHNRTIVPQAGDYNTIYYDAEGCQVGKTSSNVSRIVNSVGYGSKKVILQSRP